MVINSNHMHANVGEELLHFVAFKSPILVNSYPANSYREDMLLHGATS